MDLLCCLCLEFVMLVRLFIAALWSPVGNYKFSLVHRIGENVCLNIVHCKRKE